MRAYRAVSLTGTGAAFTSFLASAAAALAGEAPAAAETGVVPLLPPAALGAAVAPRYRMSPSL